MPDSLEVDRCRAGVMPSFKVAKAFWKEKVKKKEEQKFGGVEDEAAACAGRTRCAHPMYLYTSPDLHIYASARVILERVVAGRADAKRLIVGPLSTAELAQMLRKGEINGHTLARCATQGVQRELCRDWTPIGKG